MAQKPDIRPWVYKAEEDYRAALTLARKRRDPVPDNVCFSAQQCVEKYLKAFLVHHRIGFPKTHDLVELLKIALAVDPLLEVIRPNVRELLPYAVAFRYPGEEATPDESRRAVLAMKNVREFLAKGWAYLEQRAR
jgi:HEPN domain-containing protein